MTKITLDQMLENGLNALKERKIAEAEKIFKVLLNAQPMNPEINHFYGITLQLLNKIDEAIISYKTATKINPNFAEAHKDLGNMLYRLGKIYQAEQSYKQAIAIKPNFTEAITVLNVISEQKKVLLKIQKAKSSIKIDKKNAGTRLISNPFVKVRKVEKKLISFLHNMKSIELNKTNDIRYGNGRCSADMKLFENKHPLIKKLSLDLTKIMRESVKSEIHIMDSFFNILGYGSGTTPHRHIDPFDKVYNIANQKCSLVYYLSVGDQSCNEPGILKIYDPDEEILPSEGSVIIIPSDRKHSAVYKGEKDRVMIGVNFYSLI